MRLAFTIETQPKRKQRPRITRHGTYTPKETMVYEGKVKTASADVMRRRGVPMFRGPVTVDLTFRLNPPASLSKKKRQEMLSGVTAYTGAMDLDNLLKAVLDGMNKTVFEDDRLIVALSAKKLAAEVVGIDVIVESYGGKAGDEGDQDGSRVRGGSGQGGASPTWAFPNTRFDP